MEWLIHDPNRRKKVIKRHPAERTLEIGTSIPSIQTIKNGFKKAGIHSYPEDEPTPSAQTDTENNARVISISDSSDMETNGEDGRPASTGLENLELLQIDDDQRPEKKVNIFSASLRVDLSRRTSLPTTPQSMSTSFGFVSFILRHPLEVILLLCGWEEVNVPGRSLITEQILPTVAQGRSN